MRAGLVPSKALHPIDEPLVDPQHLDHQMPDGIPVLFRAVHGPLSAPFWGSKCSETVIANLLPVESVRFVRDASPKVLFLVRSYDKSARNKLTFLHTIYLRILNMASGTEEWWPPL